MGITVALSTCGPLLEVALRMAPDHIPSTVRLAGVSRRSSLLLAALDLLMEDADAKPGSIDRILVSRGPGSFTGIRSGLATVSGLMEATGARGLAFDSLTMQAARCIRTGIVWAAQPGRRGEVYGRQYRVGPVSAPEPLSEIEILSVEESADRSPWVACEGLDLGDADRVEPPFGSAEALFRLVDLGVESEAMEPLYVEGPPIHGGGDCG